MIRITCLFLATWLPGGAEPSPGPSNAPALSRPASPDLAAEFKRRFAEAKDDYDALWKLVDWCEANSLMSARGKTLKQLIKLEPEDAKARELLGHVKYEGRWFTSEKKLAAHKKKAAAAIERERAARAREHAKLARASGWIELDGEWVHPDDASALEQGLVWNADTREWWSPKDVERAAEGWTRQDSSWVSPEEKGKADKGFWKCGSSWLSLPEANRYHAELGQPWRLQTDYFELRTTLPRALAEEAALNIDHAYRDLVRIYGAEPRVRPVVLVVSSLRQYEKVADARQPAGYDQLGLSTVHGAFFADGWTVNSKKRHMQAGVASWDLQSSTGKSFGRLFARHAAGQSFGEALDPSRETVRSFFEAEGREREPLDVEAFWSEKLVPRWFRYGAAAYVERFFTDPFINQGGDARWTIAWSIENIQRRGGLPELEELFAFDLDGSQPDLSAKLITEAGLLVAFIVDGRNAAVDAAHEEVKAVFKSADLNPKKRDDFEKAFEKLETALAENLDALRSFAGLE